MLEFIKGKKILQSLFYKLYKLALLGMNYSAAHKYASNGESYVLKLVNKNLRSDRKIVIFDVGANVGNYSQHVINIFKEGYFELFAFEPSRTAYQQLHDRFRAKKDVKLFNMGLSNKKGQLTLHSHDQYSSLSSVYPRDLSSRGIELDKIESIVVTTLDEFCQDNKIERVDFLKLDVEGHEMAVLEGSQNMLNKGLINMVQFEFGGCNIDSRTYFKDFFKLLNPEFKLYRIVKDGIVKLPDYHEKLEIFQTCNYLSVKRSGDISLEN